MQGHDFLLKKAIGSPFYDRSTLIAIVEASVSTKDAKEKSGSMRIEATIRIVFIVVKVLFAMSSHINFCNFSKSARGEVRVA